MNEQTVELLLRSLLERLEADARTESPKFLAAVSSSERAALAVLLKTARGPLAPAEPVQKPTETAPSPTALEDSSIAGTTNMPVSDVEIVASPEVALIETGLTLDTPEDADCVLCLDFGTARSKAFAAVSSGDNSEPELIELGLGRRDGEENTIYSVASSIWISDEGRIYVGSEAMRRSAKALLVEGNRRRIDSVKQQLTLMTLEHDLAERRLEPELNPTSVPLNYEHAVCLFLAYLTDLSVSELESRGKSRYVRRRFTIPSWRPEQRAWAESALAKYMVRAQLLADTFHGQWADGILAETWRKAVAAARVHDSRLTYLLDPISGSRGVLEPLAAGSGRVWADSRTKNLILVVDVGAGTTDFSLFWVVQNIGNTQRRAFQVFPYSDAIRMAGDFIDERLLLQIVARAHGSSDELVRKRIETVLRLTGLRSLKERLFITGELQVTLDTTDQTVALTLDEFLANEQVKGVVSEIEKALQRFLSSVDNSWSSVTDNAQIVITGGGANMPNIRALADRVWDVAGKRVKFKPADPVPTFIAESFSEDFQREYPQLAVAIGGVLPVLDEKSRMPNYMGSSSTPGPLSSYQVTGS
jgi:molecular chaperone HscA